MRTIIAFALLYSMPVTCGFDQNRTAAAEPLTVMTWNLEWFYDDEQGDNYSALAKEKSAPNRTAWNWRRDAIAESISTVQPTILAVQEVESRRVLWYLTRALARNHSLEYQEIGIQSRDHFTEQDVGMLFRPPADALLLVQGSYPQRLRRSKRYFDVSKHLQAVFEIQHRETSERVTVLNVHLRSRAEGAPVRVRQARLLQYWISSAIRAGENVIVLGDFNTEETGSKLRPASDIGVASGLETAATDDDLVDLHLRLPESDRATHLLGGQFDRIMCSQSLLDDDPLKEDLVFSKIKVLGDLAIRGGRDKPNVHWNNYWNLPADKRDLSDHYPVLATFEVR